MIGVFVLLKQIRGVNLLKRNERGYGSGGNSIRAGWVVKVALTIPTDCPSLSVILIYVNIHHLSGIYISSIHIILCSWLATLDIQVNRKLWYFYTVAIKFSPYDKLNPVCATYTTSDRL